MDLFGAATTGVDPQTGSYLNKQQRVAMFRASRGMGGGGGGAEKEQKRNAVSPQSAIVVANKMSEVVQQLQQNNQESVQAVNAKVEQNRRDIANLYKAVEINRDKEADQEKLETRDLRREREGFLRGAREKLVEGLSAAVSGLANFGRQAANAALSPVRGLWDKIKDFITNITLAWAALNADTIIDKVGEFINWVKSFRFDFKFSLDQIGGIFSLIDIGIRAVGRLISRIASTIWNITKFISTKIFQLVKKIFTPILRFVGNLIKGIVSNIKKLVSNGLRSVKNAIKNGINGITGAGKNADDVAKGVGQGTKGAIQGAKQTRAWYDPRRITDFVGDKIKPLTDGAKGFFKKGTTALSNLGGSIQKNVMSKLPQFGGKAGEEGQKKAAGFLTKMVKNVLSGTKLSAGAIGKAAGMISKGLTRLPLIGTAINFYLNKDSGMEFAENLTRSLSEAIGGMVGAKAGALVGGGLGAAAGSILPIAGTAVGGGVGAILGGVIGAILGGQLGDFAGAKAYEFVTGKEATDNGNMVQGVVDRVSMEPDASLKDPKDDHSTDFNFNLGSLITGGESTPEGMQVSEGDDGPPVESFDAPPVDMRKEEPKKDEKPQYQRAGVQPFWATADPMADIYRVDSMLAYQMTS